jgi:hypothetical protein
MAAAAIAARNSKTKQLINRSHGTVKRNFSSLSESANLISTIADDQVKQSTLQRAASHIQTSLEKSKDEFSTLPQTMSERNERKAAENLFLQDRIFKMSDPITDESRFASAWMSVTATLGRTDIYFSTSIKDADPNDEILIENTPLLLIDWIQCGSLTKLSDHPLVWKVVAESGPKNNTGIKKFLSKEIKKNEGRAAHSSPKFLKFRQVISRVLGTTAMEKKMLKVGGIAVQPPPNYQCAHAFQTLETACGQFMRISVACSGQCLHFPYRPVTC